MVKVKTVKAAPSGVKGNFMARANVNFSIPVNKYEQVRKYNNEYLDRLKAVNGDNVRLPLSMGYRPIRRGDVLEFGDEMVMDAETGNIRVYPKEIYNDMSKKTVELPCLMHGQVDTNYNTLMTLATPAMRKEIEKHKLDSARFQIKPFMEVYTSDMPDLDD